MWIIGYRSCLWTNRIVQTITGLLISNYALLTVAMPPLRPSKERKKLMARVIPGTTTISKQCRWPIPISGLKSIYAHFKAKKSLQAPFPSFSTIRKLASPMTMEHLWKVTPTEKTDNKCETNNRPATLSTNVWVGALATSLVNSGPEYTSYESRQR